MICKIKERWLTQAYQRGCLDSCESPSSFETEEEAMACAREYAESTPHTADTEHECVVFKAVATYRGRLKSKKYEL